MRYFSVALVTLAFVALSALGDAGILKFAEKSQDGWDWAAFIFMIYFAILAWKDH